MKIFTKHFLERIKQRNINLLDIKRLLNNEEVKNDLNTQGNYVKQTILNGYMLRVIFRIENSNSIVITAYKTSKLKNYS